MRSEDKNEMENAGGGERAYTLNAGMWNSVFAVPSDIVDRHLRLAGGAQIKVMIYLLRHCGRRATVEELSRAAGLSPGDAADAVAYWVGAGLIKEDGGKIEPSGTVRPEEPEPAQTRREPARETVAEATPDKNSHDAPVEERPRQDGAPAAGNAVAENSPKPKRREKVRYSYEECVDFINDTPELRQMFPVLEGILSKQLNHTEISVFVTLVRYYGLPTTCVAMLAEYCRSIGKSSIAYIEQTGIGWSQEEIFTVEQADAKINRMRTLNSSWRAVRDTLGIPERMPSDSERDLSAVWVDEWKIAPEVIKLAYDRCIDSKGRLSFRYMNGIIKRWHEQGLGSPDEIAASERDGRQDGKKSRDSGRYAPTYDIAEIEKLLDDEWAGEGGD